MNITNRLNLPAPIVNAIINDPYDAGNADISVTRLIQPARKIALEKLHANELTEDAADRLWALMGQLGHLVLERAGQNSGIVEKRMYATMNGWSISGRLDILLADAVLVDYKVCSVWQAKNETVPADWNQQTNCLAWLARNNGHAINAIQIVCLFRDWSKLEAKRDRNYPQHQVKVFDVPMWDHDHVSEFVAGRLAEHQKAQEGTLPECSPEERWSKATRWAVMKKGNVRAIKLHDTEHAANSHARLKGTSHYVEMRPGEQTRCANYCAAAPFCEQWKALSGQLPEQPEPEPEAEPESEVVDLLPK